MQTLALIAALAKMLALRAQSRLNNFWLKRRAIKCPLLFLGFALASERRLRGGAF
jgi:hypothetical protein